MAIIGGRVISGSAGIRDGGQVGPGLRDPGRPLPGLVC